MNEYTRDDLVAWLHHPVTKDLVRSLQQFQDDIKEGWASGNFDSWDRNNFELGRLEGIENFFEAIEQLKAQFEAEDEEEVTHD